MKTRNGAACAMLLLAWSSTGSAALITGPLDPDYNTLFQGASAATFAGLGFTVGTGPTDLKVDSGIFIDPAGLIFGAVVPGLAHGSASGTTTGKLNYAYFAYAAVDASVNARDYQWLQNYGTNATTNPALDTPWNGTIWDLGGQANQAVVFPIVDHGLLPNEAVEYTVYLGNNPTSANLGDWTLVLLDTVYMQGWEADDVALADGFTTVWKLPGNQTFRYVSVHGVGSQALQPVYDTEDEIDAVAGLTVSGGGLQTPLPATLGLLVPGLVLLYRRRRAPGQQR